MYGIALVVAFFLSEQCNFSLPALSVSASSSPGSDETLGGSSAPPAPRVSTAAVSPPPGVLSPPGGAAQPQMGVLLHLQEFLQIFHNPILQA